MTDPPPASNQPSEQAVEQAGDPAAARIMTWNLWARHQDWRSRAAAISATIAAASPDILAVQEAWWDEATGTHQTTELALRHGYHHSAQHHDPNAPAHGLGLLSRWPITSSTAISLPAGDAPPEHRTALMAALITPAGPRHIYVTHLNARPDHSAVRRGQLAAITRHIRQHTPTGTRAVICGDLNAEPDSDEIHMMTGLSAPPTEQIVFQDAWRAAPNTNGPGDTWDNRNPHAALERLGNTRLDYILIQLPTHGSRGAVLSAQVIDGVHQDVWGSDHSALLALIDLS